MAESFINNPWYKKWWGILLIIAMSLVAAALVIFIFLTAKYWNDIKQGKGGEVLRKLQQNGSVPAAGKGFTVSDKYAIVSPRTADRARLETADDPYLGRESAPLVIVEFVDFKCPNCKTAAPIMHRVAEQYGSRVKIIMRDFPIESIHPGAEELSRLAFCAARQNRFWELHDVLYGEQDALQAPLSAEVTQHLASRSGADILKLQDCLKTGAPAAEVKKDYVDGLSAGVRGTPTFFINGEKVEGVVEFEDWERFFQNAK